MNDRILQDVSSSGRVRPWREKQMKNELLANAYDDVNPDKAKRLRECCKELVFVNLNENNPGAERKLKLVGMWNCRVRLCPICSWRRSLKTAAQMHKITKAITADKKRLKYIFLTLTVKNCTGDDLEKTITQMTDGFNNLMRTKEMKEASKGWFRSMEVTHNVDPKSSSYNTYHPHFHVLIAVSEKYFKTKAYIKQERFGELWKRSAKLDYDPVVDVRNVGGTLSKAIAEASKYATKDSEYIIPEDWDLTTETVRILDSALHKRRFIAYGGILKEYHKKLNLDKPDEGDLVHVDPDEKASDYDGYKKIAYFWYSGYRQYMKAD